jgi:hypothetical protein
MQCVLTPAEKFMPMTNEEICAQVDDEVSHLISPKYQKADAESALEENH